MLVLVALFSSAIQESIQSGSEIFTDFLLQNARIKNIHYVVMCNLKGDNYEKSTLFCTNREYVDLQWISCAGMHQLHQQKAAACNRIKTQNNFTMC